MGSAPRCTTCAGYLVHDYISTRGIDVYRCQYDPASDGRFFILSADGPIEVRPIKKGKGWEFVIVDVAAVAEQAKQKRLQEEIASRTAVYLKSQKVILDRFPIAEGTE